ncbi:hypothetical protein BV923_00740 [Pectobacterium odoriferum]|uniref:hypothetical protein n=1 Tax=Pectobacterium odoriferum TaxID=78398 RepID=UPI000CD28296|nr:hypothetical protein [Pectobacterium odoriferum]POE24984.1 hypothetical protein BV923_00740 [Pectobacterium odoriferum]
MKYFRWTIVVLLTPISILALGVIYNSFRLSQFEWGSVSDWVSSTANVVMAGAALYAAWNAKDWLSPGLRNKGFNLAVELRNKIPPMLRGIVNYNNIDMMRLDEFTDHIESKISHVERNKIDRFSIALLPAGREKNELCKKSVNNVIQSIDSSIKTLEDTLKELEVFGWILKDDNKFNDLIEKLRKRILKLRDQDDKIDDLIDFIKKSQSNGGNYKVSVFISEYESIKKIIYDSNTSVNEDRNCLIECINKCFDYKEIQDPFNFK